MSDAQDPHGAPRPPGESEVGAYDLVREAQRRALAPDERARLDAELELDPQLAQFAREYPQAHAATELIGQHDAATARPDAWTSLERHLRAEPQLQAPGAPARRGWAQRIAAAALIGIVCAGAWWGYRATRERGPGVVTLPSIDVELVNAAGGALDSALAEPPAQLDGLATYSPVLDGRIQWLASIDQGLAFAKATQRPMLLFGMYRACPWCIQMQAEGLRDETVLALAEEFVPVRLVYDELAPELVQGLHARGYPLFELWSSAGELVHSFPGFSDAAQFVEHLDDASTADQRRAAPAWAHVRAAAQQYDSALAAEREGRFAAAYATFQNIVREPSTAAIGGLASAGLERIALHAARALRQARGQVDARESVAAAERAFHATPFERDFALVREALDSRAQFPALAAPQSR